MARRDWRYKRLGELAGISSATMSAITGGKTIRPSTAQRIADALQLPLQQLVETKEANAEQYGEKGA
jgi:DNA-binding Xre family transcriptional regulator